MGIAFWGLGKYSYTHYHSKNCARCDKTTAGALACVQECGRVCFIIDKADIQTKQLLKKRHIIQDNGLQSMAFLPEEGYSDF